MTTFIILSLIAQLTLTITQTIQENLNPERNVVTLPYGRYRGVKQGNVTQYLGIPFAQPPVGDLRFRLPQPPRYAGPGVHDASAFGPACPQEAQSFPPGINFTGEYASISEDCLTINVLRPTDISLTEKLPIFFWLHGGGFEIGDSTDTNVLPLIERSLSLGTPIMAVIANSRLNGFGFLAGNQVLDEGVSNLGIQDQIFALQWIKSNIQAFGGNPDRVILSGVSGGAFSAGMLLVAEDGTAEKLFHGIFMESGATFSIPSVASGEEVFQNVARASGCADEVDTLDCLRKVPYEKLLSSINNNSRNLFQYSSLSNDWKPRVDGKLLRRTPPCAISQGLYYKVPIIAGNCDDEGTLFSLSNTNVTTDEDFREYINTFYLSGASEGELDSIEALYPQDPTQGSPFDTGTANTLTPQFKRLAAILGDIVFQGPRRHLLAHVSQSVNAWSFLNKRGKSTPILGSAHATDLAIWFARNTTDFTAIDALINFVRNLDPNTPKRPSSPIVWPTWDASNPSMLTFRDSLISTLTVDDFRSDAIGLVNNLSLELSDNLGLCN